MSDFTYSCCHDSHEALLKTQLSGNHGRRCQRVRMCNYDKKHDYFVLHQIGFLIKYESAKLRFSWSSRANFNVALYFIHSVIHLITFQINISGWPITKIWAWCKCCCLKILEKKMKIAWLIYSDKWFRIIPCFLDSMSWPRTLCITLIIWVISEELIKTCVER